MTTFKQDYRAVMAAFAQQSARWTFFKGVRAAWPTLSEDQRRAISYASMIRTLEEFQPRRP